MERDGCAVHTVDPDILDMLGLAVRGGHRRLVARHPVALQWFVQSQLRRAFVKRGTLGEPNPAQTGGRPVLVVRDAERRPLRTKQRNCAAIGHGQHLVAKIIGPKAPLSLVARKRLVSKELAVDPTRKATDRHRILTVPDRKRDAAGSDVAHGINRGSARCVPAGIVGRVSVALIGAIQRHHDAAALGAERRGSGAGGQGPPFSIMIALAQNCVRE